MTAVATEEYVAPPPTDPTSVGFRRDPRTWLRKNLFNSPASSALTMVFGLLLGYLLYRAARYLFVTGRWEFIRVQLISFMVGPNFFTGGGTLPRLWTAVYLLTALAGVAVGVSAARGRAADLRETLRRAAPALLGLAVLLSLTATITPTLLTLGAIALFVGVRLAVARVPVALARRAWVLQLALFVAAVWVLTRFQGGAWDTWGGLLLTVFVAATAIVASFPLGVLLALGRRSSFPAIRPICVGYIELIRGVPLISLLFVGQFALGFFFPPGATRPGNIARAIIMITLFTGAYTAEIVRGGLQSVPAGQTEAAKAIGLSPLRTTAVIVLPQALRNVIPALVGQFISLLKDTTLLTIIGVQEVLGVSQLALSGDFRGQLLAPEAFAFVAFLFWVLCYSMSRASQRLEARLGVGVR